MVVLPVSCSHRWRDLMRCDNVLEVCAWVYAECVSVGTKAAETEEKTGPPPLSLFFFPSTGRHTPMSWKRGESSLRCNVLIH